MIMNFQHHEMLPYIVGLTFTAPSVASFVMDSSSGHPRQEQRSQLVRRAYHGCESASDIM